MDIKMFKCENVLYILKILYKTMKERTERLNYISINYFCMAKDK